MNAPTPDETSSQVIERPPRPRWSRRRHLITWGVLGAGIVLLAMTGTAVAVAITAMGSSQQLAGPVEADPGPLEPPSSSPSVPIQIPVSALPVDCGELVSAESISTLLGPTARVKINESTPGFGSEAMIRQAGMLECAWEDGGDRYVYVTVAPDGAAIYADNFGFEVSSAYVWVDTVGDRSVIQCNDYGQLYCSGYLVLGDFFVEAYWISQSDEEWSRESTEDLLGLIAGKIQAAGPAREVVMPVGSGSAAEWLCSDSARTAASDAFGVEVFAAGGDAGSVAFWSSVGPTGANICQWGSEGLAGAIHPLGLPGGAWAIEQWRLEKPEAVIAGLGGEGDLVAECTPTACFALAAVDGDLLAFEAPVYGEAEFQQIARDFFAAVD